MDAQETGTRWSLLEDNDGFVSRDDQHYTQGFRISALYAHLQTDGFSDHVFDALAKVLPPFRTTSASQREIEWMPLAQSIFTPENLGRVPPDPSDRPYAAWLYTGFGLLQQNDGKWLNDLELLAGATGHFAFGKQAMNGFHQVFGFGKAAGWNYQLPGRAVAQVSYDVKRRLNWTLRGPWGVQLIPELGLSAGNALDYVDGGAMLRFGNAGNSDYGANHIRPAASGSAWFDADTLTQGSQHGYIFVGWQSRRMFYNYFIDESKSVNIHGIASRSEVDDVYVGAVYLWRRTLRVDMTATHRSQEYYGQVCFRPGPARDCGDTFGSITISKVFR